MDAIALVYAFAAVVSCATTVATWQRRHNTRAAVALTLMNVCAVVWSLSLVVSRLDVSREAKGLTTMLVLASAGTAVACVYVVTKHVVEPGWRLRRKVALAMAIEPVLIFCATFTNPGHQLVFTDVRWVGDGVLFGDSAILFWVHVAYCYALQLAAVRIQLRARRRSTGLFRRQMDTFMAGIAVSLLGNAFSLVMLPVVFSDSTPVFFMLTGLIMWWALFRQGLLQIVPVAREQVVDTISDAVVVLDPESRVVDVNPAALALLRRLRTDLPAEVIGLHALDVLPEDSFRARDLYAETDRHLTEPAPGLFLDVRRAGLRDERGREFGWVLVARDVSESMAQQRALTAGNETLRAHLATIEQLRAALAEEAVRDALTGVYNRRHLITALDRAVIQSRVSGGAVSLVIVDVDHFKRINDTYGHPVGDDALRAIARALQAEARAGDTVARYGGEEFVILLPDTDAQTAAARAEDVRARCAALTLRSGDTTFSITLSAGVAGIPQHAEDADGLLIGADAALYAAKSAGRNRVVLAGEVMTGDAHDQSAGSRFGGR